MQDPAAVLGYQTLFQRVVPVELRSFSPAFPLGGLRLHASGCMPSAGPAELRDFYSNFFYREVLSPAAAAIAAGGSSGSSPRSACCSPTMANNGHCASSGGGGSSVTAGRSAGLEMMMVRVLAHTVSGITTAVRLELSCDSCLFFHYAANISAASFQDIKEDCGLVIDFAQLPSLLLRLLSLLVEAPVTFLATLLLASDGSAELAFSQNLEFKTLGLITVRVEAVPQALVRGYVMMRHNALLDHCAELETELAELRSLVRQRCPNLLQLQGAPAGSLLSKGPGNAGVPRRLLC